MSNRINIDIKYIVSVSCKNLLLSKKETEQNPTRTCFVILIQVIIQVPFLFISAKLSADFFGTRLMLYRNLFICSPSSLTVQKL